MKNSCKIVTWNINGLKKLVQQGIPNAAVPTGKAISLNSVLLWLDADIIAFQETKVGIIISLLSLVVLSDFHLNLSQPVPPSWNTITTTSDR